jgi:hypothetical protein
MPGPYPHWENTKRLFKQLFIWAIVFVGGMGLLVYWFTPEKERLAQQYHVTRKCLTVRAPRSRIRLPENSSFWAIADAEGAGANAGPDAPDQPVGKI